MTSDQVLRTGVLFKKGSGTGPFGRKNWKPRYFVLTASKLTYYTYEDGDLKGEVDLKGCTEQSIEVMPADSMKTGNSASTIWRVAVNGADRRLLVAAGTEMEMNDWVEQLLLAFRINSGQPMQPRRQSLDHVSSHMPAAGAIMNTNMGNDLSRHSITDFQNFASARRSVGSAVRASLGAMPSHEFRLSDELDHRNKAEAQREQAEMDSERKNQEELLLAQRRSQAEERRSQHQQDEELLAQKQQEERRFQEREYQKLIEQQEEESRKVEEEERLLQEQQRMEALLEEQRRLKREQHERDRQEAEKKLLELEMEEQEKRHEVEVRRHFDEEIVEVEIRRRPMPQQEPVPSSPVARSPTAGAPSTPPRSSLIGDAKKEAMVRQQAEHSKRREAAIKEQQEQMRKDFLAQQKQQEVALRASHLLHKPASPPRSPPQSELRYDLAQSPAKRESLNSSSSVEF